MNFKKLKPATRAGFRKFHEKLRDAQSPAQVALLSAKVPSTRNPLAAKLSSQRSASHRVDRIDGANRRR